MRLGWLPGCATRRGSHVVDYDEAALREVTGYVTALANVEDLPSHGDAVNIRFSVP